MNTEIETVENYITIYIRDLDNGKSITKLSVPQDINILNLKRYIMNTYRGGNISFGVRYRGEPLSEDHTLADYDIKDEFTLNVLNSIKN